MKSGSRLVQYKSTKQMCLPLEGDDLSAITGLIIASCERKMGRISVYPDTEDGLKSFWERSIDYFRTLDAYNKDPANKKKLYPDLESLGVFLGITRKTVFMYERDRGEDWKDAIGFLKNCIASARKQLASTGKIPPILEIFDKVNNYGYLNTNAIKAEPDERPAKRLTNGEIQKLLASLPEAVVESTAKEEEPAEVVGNGFGQYMS